jgi:hypothetical protein
MPAFVMKVTFKKDGALMPPITAVAADEPAAILLVRSCGVAEPEDRVEVRAIRGDVMKQAFGEQPEGTIVIRGDWIWSGGEPKPMG